MTENGINYNDRVLLVGKNTSGKSVLARHIFEEVRGVRKTVIDPKDGVEIPDVEKVAHADELDLAAPVSHFRPLQLDEQTYEDAFAKLWAPRQPRLIWLDEAVGVTSASKAPPSLLLIIQQGPQKGYGLLACTQRPVGIHPALRSEAEHIVLFVPRLTNLDLKTLAPDMGIEPERLARELDELHAAHGDYAHLWYRRRTGELVHCEPLPASWAGARPAQDEEEREEPEEAVQDA